MCVIDVISAKRLTICPTMYLLWIHLLDLFISVVHNSHYCCVLLWLYWIYKRVCCIWQIGLAFWTLLCITEWLSGWYTAGYSWEYWLQSCFLHFCKIILSKYNVTFGSKETPLFVRLYCFIVQKQARYTSRVWLGKQFINM